MSLSFLRDRAGKLLRVYEDSLDYLFNQLARVPPSVFVLLLIASVTGVAVMIFDS